MEKWRDFRPKEMMLMMVEMAVREKEEVEFEEKLSMWNRLASCRPKTNFELIAEKKIWSYTRRRKKLKAGC